MTTARLARLRAAVDAAGAASMVVTNPVNVRYLTGFESSNAALVLDCDRPTVVTDYRYADAARSLDGFEVAEAARDLPAWLGSRLRDLAHEPIAFEADHLTVAAHGALAAAGAELVPATGIILALRATKDPEERDAVRRAAAITTTAYEALADDRVVGRTERELAWVVERAMREAGADVAFATIVGSGPNGARPHHHPGDRRVEPGELVVVDAGARVDGYCSDCTRTFATGELGEDLARAYEVCKRAQATALAAVRAGVSGTAVHALARGVIREGGFGDLAHGLGHGVGLEVHELPVMREEVDMTLEAGSVLTVEPGIYLAGRGGVRIEDLVIVTDDGPEVLTPFTKDLLTLG